MLELVCLNKMSQIKKYNVSVSHSYQYIYKEQKLINFSTILMTMNYFHINVMMSIMYLNQ